MSYNHSRTIVRIMSALACAAMAACSPFGEPGGPAAEVTVSIVPDRYSQTRSSFTWNEDEIRDIQVVVTTESGEIHDILYSDSPSGLHFTGQAGSLYKLWTAANIGGKVEASSLEDFTEGIRHVSKAGIERTGIPMYSDGAVGILLAEGENHATIPLTRMMARVDFSVDKQYLEYPYGFSISSVRIISPVDAYVPFSGNVMKTGGDGNGQSIDNASRQDIRLLNRGGTISLYTFENMQGTLLHGNTDPWRKVPDIIGGTARNCTYLEVTCSYTTESDSCDDITYRMYLGEDATTNFDVKRNTIYRLTLEPTEEEIRGGRGSWKIETGEWEDFPEEPVYSTEYEYELVVSPESTTLTEGETVPFTATYITREYTLADGVRISDEPTSTTEDDVTEMANWTVRIGSQYVSNQGDGVFGWAFGPGTAVVDATFGGCMDSAEINTLAHQIIYSTEYEYELVVSPESATLAEGETVSFTATYITREYTLADGERISDEPTSTTEDDVTEMANWTVRSGSQYVSNQGDGVFGWAFESGTAVVDATFGGCMDSAEINTLAHQIIYSTEYEYELVVSPESATLAEGETVSFTAVYITREYTLADGERISDVPTNTTEDDVTEMSNWSVRSGSQYVDVQGSGVFGWISGPGTAVIQASFGGCTDTTEINTLAHQINYSTEYEYELMVNPESATLAEGETVSFTATYITREYALADGERISDEPTSTTEDDVTEIANWSVRSGAQYVGNDGSGVFGWISGPGTAVIQASFGGCMDTAEINTLTHQIVYSTEYEYELVVSPASATLAEGETVSFTATYITKEYTLADGERISDEPTSTTEDDVTEMANWTVRSGSQYVDVQGSGVFGWISGPGTAVIQASFDGCTDNAEINTLAHQVNYSTEYEYELVVSPGSATLAEGETVSFSATYITREYALADGERISDMPTATTEDDVTEMANWTVRSGAQYVNKQGDGVFGWVSGPGIAIVDATFGGCTDTAGINTLAHQIVYSTEYEYELVVSPESASLAEGETVSFSATYITREYTLADGERISDVPTATTEDDVTEMANWTVKSGSQYIDNHGEGIFGWVSGPGTAVIEATHGGYSDTAIIDTGAPTPIEPTVESIEILELTNNGTGITSGNRYSYHLKCIVTMSDGTTYESTDPNDAPDFEWWSPDEGHGVTTGTDGWFDVNAQTDGDLVMSCTYEHEFSADFVVEVTEPTVVSMVLEEISGNGQTIHFSQAQYIYKATVTLSDGTVIESTDAAHRNDFEWDACLYGTGTGSYGITSVGYGRYHVQGWLDTGDTGYEISCTYGGETRYEYIFVSASGLDYSHDGYREDGSQYDTLHVYVTLECDGETVQLEVPYLNGLEVGNGYYRFQISYDCLENGYWTGCTDTVPHGTTARYNFSVSVNGGSYSTDPPSSL